MATLPWPRAEVSTSRTGPHVSAHEHSSVRLARWSSLSSSTVRVAFPPAPGCSPAPSSRGTPHCAETA